MSVRTYYDRNTTPYRPSCTLQEFAYLGVCRCYRCGVSIPFGLCAGCERENRDALDEAEAALLKALEAVRKAKNGELWK